jgi:hypothetical protein
MSGIPLWITEIERLALGKPVLLVEGDDDVVLFRHFLNQHAPGWDLRLYLASAGSKQHTITGVTVHRPDWIGIVDQDEWDPADVQAGVAPWPRLHVLPRFCIESYFCHPTELWAALPPGPQARVSNDPQALAAPIMERLPAWVAHGAMWRVLRQLYHATRLPDALEREPVTDETEIRRILEEWHARLAPEQVLSQYHRELEAARRLSPDEQLTHYIHGKKFYHMVVVQILDRLFSGRGAEDWLQRFRDAPIQPPGDLRVLLEQVLRLVP